MSEQALLLLDRHRGIFLLTPEKLRYMFKRILLSTWNSTQTLLLRTIGSSYFDFQVTTYPTHLRINQKLLLYHCHPFFVR